MMSTKSAGSARRLMCISGHLHQPEASYCSGAASIPETAFARGSPLPSLTPGRLRLYSMRFCPWAQRTRLVLLHKNIPFETVNVHLAKKPKWLFERNPLGLVPILELDGKIIFESSATCAWLDDVYPQNRLQPNDPERRAWDRTLEEFNGQVASSLYSLLRPDDREQVLKKLHRCYAFYEKVLVQRGGPFFGDEKPAMIDFLMWPHMERIAAVFTEWEPAALVDKARYPMLDAWYRSMYKLPEVKATIFNGDMHRQFLKSLVEKTFQYDIGL